MREVATYMVAHTSRSVGDLQAQTHEFVEGHCHNLEARIKQNQAETRHTVDQTKAAVDQLSTQLAQLVTQLAENRPARTTDVAMGQHQLSQDVNIHLQAQSRRIDTVTDSV